MRNWLAAPVCSRGGHAQREWPHPCQPCHAPVFYLLGSSGLPWATPISVYSASPLVSGRVLSVSLFSDHFSLSLSAHMGPWPTVRSHSPLLSQWTLRPSGGFVILTSGGRLCYPHLWGQTGGPVQHPAETWRSQPFPPGGSGFVSGPGPRMAKRSRLGDVSL